MPHEHEILDGHAPITGEMQTVEGTFDVTILDPRQPHDALAAGPVAVDIETTGLNPIRDSVQVISVCADGEEPRVITKNFRRLLDLLKYEDLVFHNAAFDLAFLKQSFGFEPEGLVYDTMILSQLAYAGQFEVKSHSLAAVVERELGVQLDKGQQVSDWSGELTAEQIEYAKDDVRYLRQLTDILMGKIQSNSNIVELELSLLPVMRDMYLRGIYVDADAWRACVDEAQGLANYYERQLDIYANSAEIKLDPRGIVDGATGDWAYDHDFNFGSPKDILTIAHAHGLDLWDTRDETLAEYEHGFIVALRKYRKYSKLTSTYGLKWLERNVDEDGVVRPRWNQAATDTGRFSCSKPNMQQLPREGGFRETVKARPGYKLVVADYSQIELRIAAMVAGERTMVGAYERGEDLHKLTAALVLDKHITEVTKHDRQIAKSVNFGLLYGMGWRKLPSYALKNYGVKLTSEQAEQLYKRWHAAYPAIKQWHKRVGDQLDRRPRPVIKTKFGRVRGGEPRFTEAVNMPVQGLGADGLKLAMIDIHRHLLDSYIVLAVHDELVVEVPEQRADEFARIVELDMQRNMERIINDGENWTMPVEVEPHVVDAWEK